jgi:hypothetical protein
MLKEKQADNKIGNRDNKDNLKGIKIGYKKISKNYAADNCADYLKAINLTYGRR